MPKQPKRRYAVNMEKVNARFEQSVSPEPNSGCWLWTGCANEHGYGLFGVGGRLVRAHRFSFERLNGALPAKTVLMHKCDNPACVNPNHLRPGTQLDNIADMYAKGRDRRGIHKGEANASAKLTDADVLAIRASKASLDDLAAEHNISRSMVWNVRQRKNWRHI